MEKLKLGFQNEYNLWLYLYIFANIIGALIMWNTDTLIGDVVESRVYDQWVLLGALLLVIASYFIILKPAYNFMMRIKMPKLIELETTLDTEKVLGTIIMILQVGFLTFNVTEGVNTAGAANKSTSAWSFVWVFIPIDIMFLIYYSLFRESKMRRINLIVYLISNIIRGWAGVFLFIMFFEWCRMVREKKINYLLLAVFGGLTLLLYPYIHYMKLVFRTIGANSDDLSLFFSMFWDSISSRSYADFLEEGVAQLVGRFQITSVIVEIIHYKERLQECFASGEFLPFWSDGLPQLAYRKALGIEAPFNVGVFLTEFFFPKNDLMGLGRWNINVGFVGWFFIAPQFIIVYLLYNTMLCGLAILFLKQFKLKQGSSDIMWLAWLIFLMPGWSMAFVGFVYCLFFMILLVKLSQFMMRIKLYNAQ